MSFDLFIFGTFLFHFFRALRLSSGARSGRSNQLPILGWFSVPEDDIDVEFVRLM